METVPETLASLDQFSAAEIPPPLPERRADFMVALRRLRDSTPDDYLRALLDSSFEEYHTNIDFPPVIDELLKSTPYAGPTVDVYKFHKSIVALELARDPLLPEGRNTTASWKPTLDRLLYDEQYRADFLFNALLPNNANVPQRSGIVKILSVADGRMYPVTGIEVASSVSLNLKMLQLHGRGGINYEAVTVMRHLPPTADQPHSRYEADSGRTRKLNLVLQHAPFMIKKAVGIDILGAPTDERVKELARVNSFRLGELRDERRQALFTTLLASQAPEIGFHFDDAASDNFDHERLLFKHPEVKECDFVFVSTVLYMLDTARRRQMIENFIPLLRRASSSRPAGRLVVLDYIDRVQPDGQIVTAKYWDPYTSYGAWTYKADEPEHGLHKVMSVEEGRMRRVVYEPALGRLAWAPKLLGIEPSPEAPLKRSREPVQQTT